MHYQKLIRVIGLLSLIFGLCLATNAQRGRDRQYGRWEYLGQARVDGTIDHDRVPVRNSGAFRSLQFRIRDGAIAFQRVVVHFENGQDFDIQVRDRIPAGGQTRAIDLPGDRRRIQSVEFWYEKANWGRRRPTLNLFGRR